MVNASDLYHIYHNVQYSLLRVQSVLINIQVTAVSSVEPGLNSDVYVQERYKYMCKLIYKVQNIQCAKNTGFSSILK